MKRFSYTIMPAFCAALLTLASTAAAQTLSSATTMSTDRPASLSMNDKKFVKDTLDSAYFELDLIDRVKKKSKLDSTKNLAKKMGTDINKMWSELAPTAQTHGEKVPTELSGSDKIKAERLGKVADDQFDKELLKVLTKETQRLSATFDNASKTAEDPNLKRTFIKWSAAFKAHDTQADLTEKEVSKK